MTRAFADTVYWVARINPRDQWHAIYKTVSRLKLVTTDEVLDEVLAHFSAFGPAMRSRAAAIIRQILAHPARHEPSGMLWIVQRPRAVMRGWVGVNRFFGSAVNGQIGLLVARQTQLRQFDRAVGLRFHKSARHAVGP